MKFISTTLLTWWISTILLTAQTVTTITTSASKIDDDIIFDQAGNLFGSNYVGSKVYKRTPNGQESIFATGIVSPNGMAFNDDGTLLIADNVGNKIYKLYPDGTKVLFSAAITGPSGMLRMENSDTILVTAYPGNKIWKLAPDGSVSEFLNHPQFDGPVGLCYDDNHNLYIANFSDRKIFKVPPGGQPIFFVQPPLGQYIGFLAYANGYIYATAMNAHKIYRIDLDGNYAVWLGTTPGSSDGKASVAKFNQPNGIRASSTGDTLFVSDFGSKKVRMITNLDGTSDSHDPLTPVWRLTVSPNPVVVGIAQVRFELDEATTLAISLYNQEGKLVRQLLGSKRLPTGHHQLSLDCSDLAKGTYFLQMQSEGTWSIMRKIVI